MKKFLLTLATASTTILHAQQKMVEGGNYYEILQHNTSVKSQDMMNQRNSEGIASNSKFKEIHSAAPLNESSKTASPQYFNDVVIESSSLDQRNVKISAAFNGWLYAAFSTFNSISSTGGITFKRSKDGGVTWSTLATYTVPGTKYDVFDFVVAGSDTNNLTLFNVGVNNNISGSTYILFFDKYNARTGTFLGTFGSNISYGTRKVYDVSIASDYKFPAAGASPYGLGILYSVYSSLDSVIFLGSTNGGSSLNVRQPVFSTGAYCRNVSIDYGRSFSWSNGRYFGAWERLSSSLARNGNIYTSHSNGMISSAWIASKNLDSLFSSTTGLCRNPDIAVQHNNTDNDSSGVTAVVVYERDWTGTGSDYDILGVHNKRAATNNYWKYFQIMNNNEKDNSPDMVYDPANNNFLAVYHDSTNHKLPYCINGMNMTNPSTWGYITSQYNDLTTNIVSPWPRIDINPAAVKAVHVWNSEGAGGNGVSLFDAENLYTVVKETSEITTSGEVYPNPARDNINLKFELKNTQSVSMELYDAVGNVVIKDEYPGLSAGKNFRTVNINNLPDGVYLLKLTSDKILFSKKIVKVGN